jgi:hypothetical protein
MKYLFTLILSILFAVCAFAQQENYNKEWVQGVPRTFKTTFTSTGPVNQFWDSTALQTFQSGHSNICAGSGNLLLATDGCNIYDANRITIDNGDTICSPLLTGVVPSFPMQSTIILPLGDSIYYIFFSTWSDSAGYKFFYLGANVFPDQVLYNLVDMKENNYAGKVTKKKMIGIDSVRLAQANMTAVRHGNGNDWWVIKHGGILLNGSTANKTYTFLVKKDTVLTPNVQTFPNTSNGKQFGGWSGQSTFNNSGTKYVAVDYMRYLFLADFDRCTGLFSNAVRMDVPINSPIDSAPSGACFSPNDSFLYVSLFRSVWQLEIYNPDSATAWVKIADGDTISNYFQQYVGLQLGADQKIYVGNASNGGSTMSVINNPNAKGIAADFCPKCLRFPKINGQAIGVSRPPNMPNYTLGIDPKCPPNPNSISPVNTTETIRPYPNPATSSITIEYPMIGGWLELVDMIGGVQLRAELKAGSTKATISTAELLAGVYVYRCLLKNGNTVSGRLVIGR